MADVILSYTIPSDKVLLARDAFLRVYPNITNDPDQWSDAPLTDLQWIKYKHMQWLQKVMNRGRRLLLAVPPDPDYIEE